MHIIGMVTYLIKKEDKEVRQFVRNEGRKENGAIRPPNEYPLGMVYFMAKIARILAR